jgi:hypothetical protein
MSVKRNHSERVWRGVEETNTAPAANPAAFIKASEMFGTSCKFCGGHHKSTTIYKCESCCRKICSAYIFKVEETGFFVHITDTDPEDLEESCCGLASPLQQFADTD